MKYNRMLIGVIIALVMIPFAFAPSTHHNSTDLVYDAHMDEGSDNTCDDGKDVCDFSGQGLNGTFNGDAGFTATAFNSSFATTYDGNGDFTQFDDDADLETSEGTIIFWWRPLITYSSGSPAALNNDKLIDKGTTFIGLAMDTSGAIRFRQFDGSVHDILTTTTTWTSGTWYHIAATWNNSVGMGIYVDGVFQNSNAHTGDWNDVANPWTIGGDIPADNDINAIIDEVRFFDDDLTVAEIILQMNMNSSGAIGGGAPPADNPPTVTLNTPADTSFSATQTILFNATPIDDNGFTNLTLYTNESGTFQVEQVNTSTVTNNSVNTISHNVGTDGIMLWNMQVCDNNATPQCAFAGSNRTVIVDTTPPSISIATPTNATQPVNQNWVILDYTITEINLDESSYSLDGAGNVSLNNLTGSINITGLSDGSHDIEMFALDLAGNDNSLQRFFTISINTPPVVNLIAPANTTFWNTTVDINITASDPNGDSYFCEVFDDDVLIANVTNLTVYTNTSTALSAGTHNITALCDDSTDTTTNTTLYTVDTWQFWVKNSQTGEFSENFTLTFNNGTIEVFNSVTNFNLSVIPTNLPQGDNNITVTATGLGTETFTGFNINATQDVNHTFQLEPASILINFFNERTLGRIKNPLVIKFTNDSLIFVDSAVSKFVSKDGDATDEENVCDNDLSTFSNSPDGSNELNASCLVGIDNNSIDFTLKYQRATAGSVENIRIFIFAFNSNLNQFDLIHTETNPFTDTNLNTITFNLNNTDRDYEGTIKIETDHVLSNNDDMDVYEIFTNHLLTLQHNFTEVPNGVPVEISVRDIPFLSQFPERLFYVTINDNSLVTLDAYLLDVNFGVFTSFAVVNTFDVPIGDVTISAQKNLGSGFVTVAQAMTDDSGLATMFLDPTVTYQMVFVREDGSTISLNLKPDASTTKLVRFPVTAETNFTQLYDDISYQFLPQESGIGSNQGLINFSFTIASQLGQLTNFSMTITNNGSTLFTQTITGSPSGGTIIDLVNVGNISGNITVTATFFKLNETDTLTMVYTIYNITEGNYTINRLFQRLDDDEFSMTPMEKNMIGVTTLTFLVGGVAAFGGGIELAAFAGLIYIALLGMANIFGWGLIMVTALALIAIVVLKWRVS